MSHSALYFGLIIYTAIGAKVSQHLSMRRKRFSFFNSIVQLKVSNVTIKTSFRPFSLSDLFLFQIFQILELPSETDRLETHQVLKRGKKKIKKNGCECLFLWNSRDCVFLGRRKIEKIIILLCSKALLVTKRELFLQAVTNSTASASYR